MSLWSKVLVRGHTLHTAAAFAVQAAFKTELSYGNDKQLMPSLIHFYVIFFAQAPDCWTIQTVLRLRKAEKSRAILITRSQNLGIWYRRLADNIDSNLLQCSVSQERPAFYQVITHLIQQAILSLSRSRINYQLTSHLREHHMYPEASLQGIQLFSYVYGLKPTRPRTIVLAKIAMRISTHGSTFLSYVSMGLRLFGPP